MRHVIEAAADAAWDQYEQASQLASRFIAGEQIDIEETSFAEAREWHGIALACHAELCRIPTGDHRS